MITKEEYETLKKKAADYRDKAQRAQGQLDAVMSELKKLGFDTKEEAEEALEKLDAEIKAAEEKFDTAYEEFKEEWGEELNL